MVESRHNTAKMSSREIRGLLSAVPDPEIPVLSVVDLGIIRDITVFEDGVEVCVAPTYTACPATEVIERMIVSKLEASGLPGVSIKRVLSPPWSTDWISDEGRRKLAAYGIAPPDGGVGRRSLLGSGPDIRCPRCSADDTARVSEFGSTPCKASYKCNACLEPFEYFKCL